MNTTPRKASNELVMHTFYLPSPTAPKFFLVQDGCRFEKKVNEARLQMLHKLN